MDIPTLLAVAVGLVAIVNPVGVIPTFVAFTQGYTRAEKRNVILKACLVGLGVLLTFGIAGDVIFRLFSITIPAFRIAGGILIFKVAFDMLHGERPRSDSNEHEIQDALQRESIGITPLGVPLLTGPGAITTIMILVATYSSPGERLVIYGIAIATFALAFGLLHSADFLLARMGRSGLMIFTRLMGLILAAIAVQFILTGLSQVAPTLFTGGR